MTLPVYLTSAIVVLAVVVAVFRVVVRREYLRQGRLRPTVTALQYVAILAWVAFGWLNAPPDWPAVHVGAVRATVGWTLFVAGWFGTVAFLGRLGVSRSHGLRVDALRQSGAYGRSRNPQAVAFMIAMAGYLVLWPTWRNLGVLVLVVVLAHLMIRSEEEHLRDVFGSGYERYCRGVPRYLPLRGWGSLLGRRREQRPL